MKIMNDLCYEWKSSYAYHKINNFMESKDKWGTKEGIW